MSDQTQKQGVEYKSYSFIADSFKHEIVEIKGVKEHFVSGHISTADPDLVDDIVTNKCLDDLVTQIKGQNIKIDVEHELWKKGAKTTRPAGRIIEARRDEKGVWVKVHLNRNYPGFKGLIEEIKQKFIDAFSIAFRPIDFIHKEINGVKTRLLNKIHLLNVALTGNPANTHCKIGAVFTKSLNDMGEHMQADQKRYEDDGNHIHTTEENPMGMHRHQAIEKGIDNIWDAIFKMQDSMGNPTGVKTKQEVTKMGEKPDEKAPIEGEDLADAGNAGAAEKPTPAQNTQEGAEEIKRLTEENEALKAKIKTQDEMGISEQLKKLEARILERDEFKAIKEVSDATKRDEELAEVKDGLAKINGLLDAPARMAQQAASFEEQVRVKALADKAGDDPVNKKTVSGPLDQITMGG